MGASYQDIPLRAGFTIEPLKRFVNRTSILFNNPHNHPLMKAKSKTPILSTPQLSLPKRHFPAIHLNGPIQTPPQKPFPSIPNPLPLAHQRPCRSYSFPTSIVSPVPSHLTHSTTPAPPHSPRAALPRPVPEHRRQSTIYGPRSLCIRACPAPPQIT